jgi:hypothetical protein
VEYDSYKEGEVRPTVAKRRGSVLGEAMRGKREKKQSRQTIGGGSNDRCIRRKAQRALPGRER